MLWLLAGQFNTKILFLAQPGSFWALNCWRMTRTRIREMVQSTRDEGRSWGHHILGCGRITANTAVDVHGYKARLADQKFWLTLLHKFSFPKWCEVLNTREKKHCWINRLLMCYLGFGQSGLGKPQVDSISHLKAVVHSLGFCVCCSDWDVRIIPDRFPLAGASAAKAGCEWFFTHFLSFPVQQICWNIFL